MTEGKVKAALRLITNQEKGGTLPLDGEIQVDKSTTKTVRDILLEKHPPAHVLVPSAVCETDESMAEPHPVQFDVIDGPFIRSVVLRMDGAAGPSGMDAVGWK